MARPNRRRSIEGESNLALRVQRERAYRGMSYEALAKAMTDAGCSIQGSAIYKIEKGDPPRRVTVDELIALATAFDVGVENLLTPVEVLRTKRGQELLKEIDEGDRALSEAAGRLINSYVEYFDLAAYEPDMREYIDGHRFSEDVAKESAEIPLFSVTIDGQEQGVKVDDAVFRTGFRAFYLSLVEQAAAVAMILVEENNRRGGRRGPLAEGEVD